MQLLTEKNCDYCIRRITNYYWKYNNICKIFENILEENKENINFEFGDFSYENVQIYGNKYADFINKYAIVATDALCLDCLWYIVKNYNETPIGEVILCYN